MRKVTLRTRAGTQVRVSSNPVSRLLYPMRAARDSTLESRLPPDGTVGVVTPVSMGRGKSTFMRGPGGGLLYVQFLDGTFMGVSPLDLELVKSPSPKKRKAK